MGMSQRLETLVEASKRARLTILTVVDGSGCWLCRGVSRVIEEFRVNLSMSFGREGSGVGVWERWHLIGRTGGLRVFELWENIPSAQPSQCHQLRRSEASQNGRGWMIHSYLFRDLSR